MTSWRSAWLASPSTSQGAAGSVPALPRLWRCERDVWLLLLRGASSSLMPVAVLQVLAAGHVWAADRWSRGALVVRARSRHKSACFERCSVLVAVPVAPPSLAQAVLALPRCGSCKWLKAALEGWQRFSLRFGDSCRL